MIYYICEVNALIRHYEMYNIVNCRDLGGYQTPNGATKFGRALRSAIPDTPTENDLAVLRNYGIKTVIDLRGFEEVADYPSIFLSLPDFEYHHISLLESNPALSKAQKDIVAMYKLSLTEYGENYAKALRLIASLDKPFLFHCFVGKDRTGLLAALLLSSAGVSREDIIADYQVSYTYFKPFYDREVNSDSGLIWEKDETKFFSKPETMASILDYLEAEFAGVRGYLRFIGLNDDEIEKISRVLL